MSIDFEIVVSSENSQYMAWQTQLFCYSAVARMQKRPIVIVHKTSEPLREEFLMLIDLGFRVVEGPSFRTHPLGEYPPRNEVGSLLQVRAIDSLSADYILFCEPDMLFVERFDYHGLLAGEHYEYLDYAAARVCTTARRFGVSQTVQQLNQSYKIGVPYLIPVRLVDLISSRWLEVLDAFNEIQWIDIMYAFGIALALENLQAETTHNMSVNYRASEPLSGRLIHYCYGDQAWNKRHYLKHSPFQRRTKSFENQSKTVLEEIAAQIGEAKRFFLRACPRHMNIADT